MKTDAPSATANLVAKNILMVASTQESSVLVSPDVARLSRWFVAEFSPQGEAFIRRSGKRWFQSLRRVYERLTIPGLALHQALRKRFIEERVRASLLEGYSQLVVLGGGLDGLALRLCREFPETRFIELDHPATQQVKRRVIERLGLAEHNLKLLAVDFSQQSLSDALLKCTEYDAEKGTIFLAEGVLMYLCEEAVSSTFDFVRRNKRNRFVFTMMEANGKGEPCFRRTTWMARAWLRWQGEPFIWGLKAEELQDFLRERGFQLREVATSDTLRKAYLKENGLQAATLAEGESVCVCEPFA